MAPDDAVDEAEGVEEEADGEEVGGYTSSPSLQEYISGR